MRISDWSSDVCSSDLSVGSWVGTHWIVRCAIADNINVLPSTLVDENSIKPPLFASTTGYIIATGNSGGWVGTVNLASPLVVGRRDPSDKVTSGKIGRASCRERVCTYV